MNNNINIYGIVGTQRSGSNYICSALRSVPELGDPREFFNPVHIPNPQMVQESREDAIQFSKKMLENVSAHVCFGFKIHYLQFHENFVEKGILLQDAFPGIKIIFLRRMNIVSQAISLWKAELTQSWLAGMEPVRPAHYDFIEIRNRYFDLKIHDLMWRRYLSETNAQYLNLFYEDMVKNERRSFFDILCFIGKSHLISSIKKPDIKKQGDNKSIEWEKRFRQEYTECPMEQHIVEWKLCCRRWNADGLSADPNFWQPHTVPNYEFKIDN